MPLRAGLTFATCTVLCASLSALAAALSLLGQGPAPLGALLDRVRGGNIASAVAEFSTWSVDRMAAEAVSPPDPADVSQTAALALLHLETGIRKKVFGDVIPDLVNFPREVHYRLSEPLVVRVAEYGVRSSDDAALAFCRDWWVVGFSQRARREWERDAEGPIALLRAYPRFKDHPDLALLRGTRDEFFMGPESDGPFGAVVGERALSTPNGNFDGQYAQAAEREFRSAIRDDATRAEAQLRLGRVQFLLNRKRDAAQELDAAVRSASGDRFVGYLAHLFRARLSETDDQFEQAIDAYRAAIALRPDGWTARIGLSQALIMAGRETEGWSVARSILDGSRELRPDPWAFYRDSLYHQSAERLERMRAFVSQTSAASNQAPGGAGSTLPPPAPNASQSQNSTVPSTAQRFSTTTDGVRLEVLVRDGGRPVAGLSADDFDIVDQGVRQTVASAHSVSGLSITMVVDTSESVDRPEYWAVVRRSTAAITASLRAGDDVSLVTADDQPAVVLRNVADPNQVRLAVAQLRPRSDTRTALWDTVLAAAALDVNRETWRLLFVVSDGADNVSWFDRQRIFGHLVRTGVTVDAIDTIASFLYKRTSYVPPDLSASKGTWSMEGLKKSGGALFRAEQADLDRVVGARMDELRGGYIVTYQPRGGDSGWHNVTVRLKNGKRGTVTTRPGYYVGRRQ